MELHAVNNGRPEGRHIAGHAKCIRYKFLLDEAQIVQSKLLSAAFHVRDRKILFYTENMGSIFFRIVTKHQPDYVTSYSRR
jgi:hypothetical protein